MQWVGCSKTIRPVNFVYIRSVWSSSKINVFMGIIVINFEVFCEMMLSLLVTAPKNATQKWFTETKYTFIAILDVMTQS